MDASPQIMTEKIERAREEGNEAKSLLERLEPEIEDLRSRLTSLQGEAIDSSPPAENGAGNDLEEVAHRASDFFTGFSDGEYEAIRLSGDHDLEVRSGDDWICSSKLSPGTASRLLFALRLAFTETADAEQALPLVFDESFEDWGDVCLEKAHKALLCLVDSGHQAIVMGADPRLLDWVDTVIRLGEAGNGRDTNRQAA
jgi:DNA repair exonuclease SbcCD ATPase subunit